MTPDLNMRTSLRKKVDEAFAMEAKGGTYLFQITRKG
jgi:hypothetical protein